MACTQCGGCGGCPPGPRGPSGVDGAPGPIGPAGPTQAMQTAGDQSTTGVVPPGGPMVVHGQGLLADGVTMSGAQMLINLPCGNVQDCVAPLFSQIGYNYVDASNTLQSTGTSGEVWTANGSGGGSWNHPMSDLVWSPIPTGPSVTTPSTSNLGRAEYAVWGNQVFLKGRVTLLPSFGGTQLNEMVVNLPSNASPVITRMIQACFIQNGVGTTGIGRASGGLFVLAGSGEVYWTYGPGTTLIQVVTYATSGMDVYLDGASYFLN